MGMFRCGEEVGLGGKNSSIQWLWGNGQLGLGKLKCCRKEMAPPFCWWWMCANEAELGFNAQSSQRNTSGRGGVPAPATSSECILKHCRCVRGIVIAFSSSPASLIIALRLEISNNIRCLDFICLFISKNYNQLQGPGQNFLQAPLPGFIFVKSIFWTTLCDLMLPVLFLLILGCNDKDSCYFQQESPWTIKTFKHECSLNQKKVYVDCDKRLFTLVRWTWISAIFV